MTKRRETKLYSILAMLVGAVCVFFMAQTQGQTGKELSLFSTHKVQLNFLTLSQSKVFASANAHLANRLTPFGVAAESRNVVLPAGLELVVLVNNECAENALASNKQGKLTAKSWRSHPKVSGLIEQAYKITLPENQSLQAFTEIADQDPCIVGVIENSVHHLTASPFNNDPLYNEQAHLPDIHADEAHRLFWASSYAIDQDVILGVVDSGVDYFHEDLAPRMWRSPQGYFGYDIANDDNEPLDDLGHGTHVSGLAAGVSSNGTGISGVFGFHAKIMAVKVADANGDIETANEINGMKWALQNKAQIVNLSLGGPGANAGVEQTLRDMVAAGLVVLAAAGNENTGLSSSQFFTPASYANRLAGMLSVGSVDTSTGERSNFSNYSNIFVELASPGSEDSSVAKGLMSTYPSGRYVRMQGTSMATPVASGAAALIVGFLKSNGFVTSPAIVEKIILEGVLKSSALTSVIKDGNKLDLGSLSRYLQTSYLFEGDAGFERVQ